jgi:RNA polymerase sigma factor (sigma-70 family)
MMRLLKTGDRIFPGNRVEDAEESSPVTLWSSDTPQSFMEWGETWSGCLRRIRQWSVPPQWSNSEWAEEMKAEGAAAALQALMDFDPTREVPLGAYVRMRIMGCAIARYRKEWAYALHQVSSGGLEEGEDTAEVASSVTVKDDLDGALSRLTVGDRRLIERLYWGEETEAEIARSLGVSQQAVNKRKKSILSYLYCLLHIEFE